MPEGHSRRSRPHARAWVWTAYATFPLSQLVVVTFLLWSAETYGLSPAMKELVVGAGIACAVADLALFRALRLSDERRMADRRARLLEEQVELQRRCEEQVRDDQLRSVELRHRLSARLDDVERALAADGAESGVEDAPSREVADALGRAGRLLVRPASSFCEHPVVNALLVSKADECGRLGIDLSCGIEVPRDVSVPSVDLCALFSNLLDNAIQACERVEGARFVRIRSRVVAGQLVVDVENSCTAGGGECGRRADRGGATHTDRLAEHGWGLEILDDLALRYDGTLSTEETAGVFRTSVMLSVGDA